MATYSFVTRWRVHAPVAAVWDVILRVEEWPQWWRAIARAELLAPGDATSGVGRAYRLTFRTQLPYGFVFDITTIRVEPQRTIEGHAVGQLEGTGLWSFAPDGDSTLLRYDWQVKTNVTWMNVLGPVLRPAFVYNHNVVMRWGAEGLSRKLNARVESGEG